MVGVINNFGGFYPSWVYFNEARNCGATLHLPCVNRGSYKTTITGKDIFIGFVHVANLEYQLGKKISEERKANGEFPGLEDFVLRTGTTLDQLIILIRIGSFRFTGKTKAQLLWEAHMLQVKHTVNQSALTLPHSRQSAVGSQQSALINHRSSIENSIVNRQSEIVNPVLFYTSPKKFDLPVLEQSIIADVYDEVELLGFPIKHTYFDLLETSFRGRFSQEE